MSLHGRGGRKTSSVNGDGWLQGTVVSPRHNRTGAHGNS